MKNSRYFSNFLWASAATVSLLAAATLLAFWTLSRGYTTASRALFEVVAPVTWTLSRVTGRMVSSLEVWNEAVWLGKTTARLGQEAQAETEGVSGVDQKVHLVLAALPQATTHAERLAQEFEQSWLLSRVVHEHASYSHLLRSASLLLEAVNQAAVNQSRYLVLLQNTDEVRATGGFMGSYAVMDFGSENPLALDVRDIYDPSGQSVSLPSPPGQREYLSAGAGMKLVDANWDPDFPAAASTILEYFRQIRGDSQHYDGVVAVPLTIVEELVDAVGGVYVADENATVTAEQFAVLLREDRDEFFPGSRQKTQSLQRVYAALILKLNDLSATEWQRAAQRLLHSSVLSEIQAHAVDPLTQAALHEGGVDGAIHTSTQDQFFLFPVESNVGINKANRKVFRSLRAHYEPASLVVTAEFRNDFTIDERPVSTNNASYTQAPHLGYANYYRFLVSPNLKMTSIEVDGKPVPTVDEEKRTTSTGRLLTQLGFLVTLPESSSTTVMLRFAAPDSERPELVIQKQVGIAYDSVHFSCFNNVHHSPLPLTLHGRLYQSFCGEGIQ